MDPPWESSRFPVQVRHALPREFRVDLERRRTLMASAGFLCLLETIFVIGAIRMCRVASIEGGVVLMLFSAVMVGVPAGWLLASAHQSVTITDEGLEVHRMFKSSSIAWRELACIRVWTTSRGAQVRALVGDALGVIGIVVAEVVNASLHSKSDPFSGPASERVGLRPHGMAERLDGSKGSYFDSALDWPFFDALLTEAKARGIPIQ